MLQMLGNTRLTLRPESKLGLAPVGYSSLPSIWEMYLTQSQILGKLEFPRASLMLNICVVNPGLCMIMPNATTYIAFRVTSLESDLT